jgi:hypothetical protein
VADETHGAQILRQLRGVSYHIVKMPVFFKFRVTPGLIKDFRFLSLLMFFQKRPQQAGTVMRDGQMVNDTHENDEGKRQQNESQ